MDYQRIDEEHILNCISPVRYKFDKEKYSYILSSGIVYLTLDINGRLRENNRLAYQKQAKWFMQSEHGLYGRRAGIYLGDNTDFNDYELYINSVISITSSGISKTDTVKNFLKDRWNNVRAIILNSCYNLNLNLTTGKYPERNKSQ
jgi:hypothetical protein